MRCTVDVIVVDRPGPEAEDGLPCERLPGDFESPQAAAQAARAHIKHLGRPPGTAYYVIYDETGHEIGEGR
jgi:hypothetical protein